MPLTLTPGLDAGLVTTEALNFLPKQRYLQRWSSRYEDSLVPQVLTLRSQLFILHGDEILTSNCRSRLDHLLNRLLLFRCNPIACHAPGLRLEGSELPLQPRRRNAPHCHVHGALGSLATNLKIKIIEASQTESKHVRSAKSCSAWQMGSANRRLPPQSRWLENTLVQ